MKPIFESVATYLNTSFMVRKFEEKSFSAPYHFHPEIELTLILKGCGKRYVGSNMHDYFPGDLVLLGSNLPHCWKTEDGAIEDSISVVVHFEKDFLGKDFITRPELNSIQKLLNRSSHGLHFKGENKVVKNKMMCLAGESDPFKKLISFLEILNELASSKKYIFLDRQNSFSKMSHTEMQRINAVTAYIVENFQDTISLNEAASKTNMTTHAFCKYFKRITRKTFIEAVNDYRIDFATKQLINTDKPVSEIGFDSGFNDVSNFHKTFKKRLKLSPLSYRNMFMRKMG